MTCVSPPQLDDATLLQYMDDATDEGVTAHLERCGHCREQLERLVEEHDLLTRLLYRAVCPSTEVLGEYHLDILSNEETRDVRLHLAECPHCTRELAQLQDYLHTLATDVEQSALDRVKVLIARLVGGGEAGSSPSMAGVPAFAGVRGEPQGSYLYEAGDVEVVIQVQDHPDRTERRNLLGLVMGLDAVDVEAHLWRDDERVATASVDDLDNFVLSDVASGTYELILAGGDVEVHIRDIAI